MSMAIPVPGPGEELNQGPTTAARQAATVIVLRGGDEALEVLLVKRTPNARFMAGAWVFPGGSVSDAEGSGDEAHRAAALRELDEEAGISLADPGELVAFSRWITPAEVKIRFDTYFYLAAMPARQQARIDGEEVVDFGWFTPAAALQANHAGEILLVFPTRKHLEQLDAFASVTALLEYARGRIVQPVQPKVVLPDAGSGEVARIVLPGEPGYD
jgi:8-oxo-dGTP pyrophosphatase MutT (NUDIX family)